MSLFCVLAAAAPAGAATRAAKMHGARAVSFLPEQVRWSGQDRGVVDRGKAASLVVDGGNAGWSLDWLSLRSSRDGDVDCCASGDGFTNHQAGMRAWHAVGHGDTVGLAIDIGKASRRSVSPLVFPAKSTAGYASAQLTWDHRGRWSVSTGWFRQGGWGGRQMDLDVIRLGNGEPAAARGVRTALRMNLSDGGDDARTWLMLEAREGRRAVGAGAGMRHASDAGLTLTSMF
nr:hypothetical protein [Novosphingobium panipatense]